MMYRLSVGNEYVQSRPLSASELDETLTKLQDVFGGKLWIAAIDVLEETPRRNDVNEKQGDNDNG